MTDIAEVVEDVSAEAVVEGESSEPVSEPAPSTPSEPQLTPEQMRQMVTTAIEQRDTQWQAEIGRREQAATQAAQETSQPDPTPAASSDDIDEQIAALYTDDKTGRETQRAITNHLNLMLQKLGISGGNSGLTVEDVQKIAAEQAGTVRNEIRSGLSVNQEVEELVTGGVIAPAEAKMVQARYSETLRQPGMQESAADPNNSSWIIKGVVYDLVKEGKLKPGAPRKRPTPAIAPGGPGYSPAPATIDSSSSPFKSIREMGTDKLKAIRERHG